MSYWGSAAPSDPNHYPQTGRPNRDSSPSSSNPTAKTYATSLPDVFTPAQDDPSERRRGNAPLAPNIVAAANANRDAMQVPQQYRLVRKLHDDEEIWLVQRVSDEMEFVGWRWDIPRLNPALNQLLERGAGDAVAAVLNHPNLVSHIEIHQVQYWRGHDFECRDYAISDYMDAGTLRNFIDKTPVLAKVNLRTGHVLQWLPESLVWHVAVSLLSALTWLHEGVREEDTIRWADDGAATRGTKIQTPTERLEDWWPILHQDIRTDQVFFQHPRGIETYGSCKLGGFGKMFVSGHVHGMAAGTAVTSWNGTSEEELRKVILRAQADLKKRREGEADPEERKKMYEDYSSIEYVSTHLLCPVLQNMDDLLTLAKERRPYFKGTETFKVGVILWQMMTRQLLPDPEACVYCEENHWVEVKTDTGITSSDPSESAQGLPGHSKAKSQCKAWRTGVFRLDEWLKWLSKGADCTQPDAGYSPGLISLMSQLLDPHSFRRTVSTFDLLDGAKSGYLEWKETTDEGKRHVDLWDDLAQREKNRRKKEAHERDLAIKQSGDRAQEYVHLAMGGVKSL
ncbi:hypothetical protein N0V82_002253 [Gnomoniopsis sp. IMI 355080]|nr:hypothetical protein N0V82_002253 [Gnomoniopsis sp. IMI 355080]